MIDLASEIRANIAALQSEINGLRSSVKKDIDNLEKVRLVSVELRTRLVRLDELERNLALASNGVSLTSVAEPNA